MSTDESKDGEKTDQSGETSSESSAEARPSDASETARPKRMKKKKASETTASAESASAEKAPIDDSPEGKKLREAEIAFEVGDYATTRKLAMELSRSERAAIADGARDLIRRTNVDPAQMVFLAACACALFAVAFYYLR